MKCEICNDSSVSVLITIASKTAKAPRKLHANVCNKKSCIDSIKRALRAMGMSSVTHTLEYSIVIDESQDNA